MCKMMQITPIVMPSLFFFPLQCLAYSFLWPISLLRIVVYLLLKQFRFVSLTVRNALSNHVSVRDRSLEENVYSGQRALLIKPVLFVDLRRNLDSLKVTLR